MFIVCALLLCVNVVLGGGTRAGLLSDAILQLLSVAGLVAVLFRWERIRSVAGSPAVYVVGALVLLPLLQLVPLPAQVVALLEPNTTVVDTLRLAGLDPSFRALSAAPYATALSALSLLPPMTLFWMRANEPCERMPSPSLRPQPASMRFASMNVPVTPTTIP